MRPRANESQRLEWLPGVQSEARALQRHYDTGCIYFIEGRTTGLIKIGFSRDPIYRAMDIAAESSERLVYLGTIGPAEREHEQRLHRRFAAHRDVGEWFRPGDDLVAYIQMKLNRELPPPRPIEAHRRAPLPLQTEGDIAVVPERKLDALV